MTKKVRKISQNSKKLQFWPFLRPNYGKIRLFKAIKMMKLCLRNEKLSVTFILPNNSPLYGASLTKNSPKYSKIDKNRLFLPFLAKMSHFSAFNQGKINKMCRNS